MIQRRLHLSGPVLATLLACTVGDVGGSSFSAGASAGEGASATDGVGSGETAVTNDHGNADGSGDGASTGNGSSEASSAGEGESDSAGSSAAEASSDGTGTPTDDGGSSSTGTPNDLDDGILDIIVTAHDDCTFTTVPSSITVPEGTEFTVNWISAASSDIEFDIAKIDPFNQVPIVIGMEPGTAYHDEVRSWCGVLFTGTFDFRVTSCFDPQYIPVDCGG
ncbi:MAG: hypothetical protein IAG13_14405 [Deltaproteobacteria bacterium]|nr:hypothetical protein [Nannocystaceae bacterium]